jgi:leucyl aminopeptidase
MPTIVTRDDRIARLVAAIDSDRLKSFLVELTSFDDRSATTDNGTRAADFVAQRATQVGASLQGFSVRKVATKGYAKQPSVVATLPGSNSSLPHIVIGGHMDTMSYNKPGADDDGSGSTTVMETLRVIANSGLNFERTIDFMWYAAEERGLVGSANVVRDFKSKQINVAAAIQFDMTGWLNPVSVYDVYLTTDYVDSGLNETLATIINTYLPGMTIGYGACGYACSDHASWTQGGVPAVFPFESDHQDYNRRIHTSSDKIDYLTIDHMAKFARIAVAFVGQMAGVR